MTDEMTVGEAETIILAALHKANGWPISVGGELGEEALASLNAKGLVADVPNDDARVKLV